MINRTSILTIRFENEIFFKEIPAFRGAIISKVPADITLFHNHIDDGLRYRYPLIQYKRINGKAAIICIGDGTEAIGNFFAGADFNLNIGTRQENFTIEQVKAEQWIVQVWDNTFNYTIRKWLSFNSENYKEFSALEGIVEKTAKLEKLLIGNILSMCTGFLSADSIENFINFVVKDKKKRYHVKLPIYWIVKYILLKELRCNRLMCRLRVMYICMIILVLVKELVMVLE